MIINAAICRSIHKPMPFIATCLLCLQLVICQAAGSCGLHSGAGSPNRSDFPGTHLPDVADLKTDTVPRPIGYTNDYEHLFSTDEAAFLDSILAHFEQKTAIQIALVTIDTTMTIREDFDNYVLRIGKVWAVGQADKRNGIIIGISRGYRKMRIEKDYGIEKVLSNSETKMIIDTAFIPSFKKGKYFDGTLNGLQTLIRRLE